MFLNLDKKQPKFDTGACALRLVLVPPSRFSRCFFSLPTPLYLCSTEGGKKQRLVIFTTSSMTGRRTVFFFIYGSTPSTKGELTSRQFINALFPKKIKTTQKTSPLQLQHLIKYQRFKTIII